MRKFVKFTALLLIAVILTSFVSLTCFADTQTPTMTVLGDSIASGYGLANVQNESYPMIISSEKSYDIYNEAVPGYTTTDLITQLRNTDDVRQNVSDADLLLISIGGNDLIGLLQNSSIADLFDIMINGTNATVVKNAVATTRANLTAIYSELRDLNDDAVIIFQTQYNPLYASEQFSAYADMADSLAPVFNGLFYSLAQQSDGVYVADVYTAFDNYYSQSQSYDIIQQDGIHPSAKGHAIIAEVILKLITDLETQGVLPTEPIISPQYLLGDADRSEKITISDATTIQKHLTGLITLNNETDELCADADQSGDINIKDATAIQKYLAQLLPDTLIGTYISY